jgi:hypothetical protein
MYANILFNEFGKLLLNTEETAAMINRSVISLKRDRNEGVGIPVTYVGKGKGSDRAYYSVHDISKFIASRKRKVL